MGYIYCITNLINGKVYIGQTTFKLYKRIAAHKHKAKHNKWGIGTIVSVKGTGEEIELKIAFPGQGIKALMQKYAPISKV